ncbi:MAG: hypothetical protein IJ438_03145 [Clostridia bacterium]|nr:hypothetical protein [Clostridia bacterium]
MKVRPGIEEVRHIAASGECRMLPASCEMLWGVLMPIETLRIPPLLPAGIGDGAEKTGLLYIPWLRSKAGDHLHERRNEGRKTPLLRGVQHLRPADQTGQPQASIAGAYVKAMKEAVVQAE